MAAPDDSSSTDDAAMLAQAGALSAGLLADGAQQRRFSLTLDLRRFAAGPRLPLGLASLVLEAHLPPELSSECLGAVVQGASCGRVPQELLMRWHAASRMCKMLTPPPPPVQPSSRPATAGCHRAWRRCARRPWRWRAAARRRCLQATLPASSLRAS